MVKYSEQQIDLIFQSLADPTRRDILHRIIQQELNVGDIASSYKISLPAVSKHLRVLEKADLVTQRKEGRDKFFTANPRALLEIQKYIEFYTKFWNERFNSVEKLLKERRDKKHARQS